MSKEDSFISNISNTPLSFTSKVILNAFLYVTFFFIFLYGLFYFVIMDIEVDQSKSEIKKQLVSLIDGMFPAPINFSMSGKFNCDQFNAQIKPILMKQCNSQFNSTPINSTSGNTFSCDLITDPSAKLVCKNKDRVVFPTNQSTLQCDDFVNQLMQISCDQGRNLINTNIASVPLFASLGIRNADDLYGSIYNALTTTNDGNNILDNYIRKYSEPEQLQKAHNESVIKNGYNISIILIIITMYLLFFLKYAGGKYINVTKLLIENIIVFSAIVCIEFWFFYVYAQKYKSILPSELSAITIEHIKTFLVPNPSYPIGYKINYTS